MTSRTRAGPRDSKETGRLVLLVPTLPSNSCCLPVSPWYSPWFGGGGGRKTREADVAFLVSYAPQIGMGGLCDRDDLVHTAG